LRARNGAPASPGKLLVLRGRVPPLPSRSLVLLAQVPALAGRVPALVRRIRALAPQVPLFRLIPNRPRQKIHATAPCLVEVQSFRLLHRIPRFSAAHPHACCQTPLPHPAGNGVAASS